MQAKTFFAGRGGGEGRGWRMPGGRAGSPRRGKPWMGSWPGPTRERSRVVPKAGMNSFAQKWITEKGAYKSLMCAAFYSCISFSCLILNCITFTLFIFHWSLRIIFHRKESFSKTKTKPIHPNFLPGRACQWKLTSSHPLRPPPPLPSPPPTDQCLTFSL